jgi:hypothetical protein
MDHIEAFLEKTVKRLIGEGLNGIGSSGIRAGCYVCYFGTDWLYLGAGT